MASAATPLHITVEGWRQLPHSYSLVNHYQLRQLLRHDHVSIYHRDLPLLTPSWNCTSGLHDAVDETLVMAIPEPPAEFVADVTYRIGCPFDFTPGLSRRTVMFAATEFGCVLPSTLRDRTLAGFGTRLADSGTLIATPTEWSRQGLIASGAAAGQVVVVPHGMDPEIFKALEPAVREHLRQALGWQDTFVFFSNGLMWRRRHGIEYLLQAFSRVVERHPHVRLVIKGREDLFSAKTEITAVANATLQGRALEQTLSRLAYHGDSLAAREIAVFYQCADAYVSTSQAEGFNLPVLEAAACGLPVICPALGPTTEFADPGYTLAIESSMATTTLEDQTAQIVVPDLDHLIELMNAVVEREAFRTLARAEGWQRAHAEFTWEHVIARLLPLLESR